MGKNSYYGFYREKEHVRQRRTDLEWASLNHFRWLWDMGAALCYLAPGSVGDEAGGQVHSSAEPESPIEEAFGVGSSDWLVCIWKVHSRAQLSQEGAVQ